MQNADNTLEHLEMAALKAGNLTQVPDDIDWFIPQIDRLGQWQCVNNFPMIQNFLPAMIACEIRIPVEP